MSVFPAHAGMSRTSLEWREYKIGFPRSRGDEPGHNLGDYGGNMFSPLTRG